MYFFLIVMICLKIYISRGSVVTQLKCCGIFNNPVVANCPQSVPVKES